MLDDYLNRGSGDDSDDFGTTEIIAVAGIGGFLVLTAIIGTIVIIYLKKKKEKVSSV